MAKQEENGAVASVFATVEEARTAGKPAGKDKWKLFAVSVKGGSERYVFDDGAGSALRRVAKEDGYTARCLDSRPMSPAIVGGMLAALSAEDRAAILAQFAGTAKKGK